MPDLHDLSARQLAAALSAGEVTPRECAEHYLARIAEHDGTLGAFAEVTATAARERTTALAAADTRGPLWGLPLGDKDLVARAGVPTRFGSRVRAGFVPTVSDPIVDVLDEAGTVSLGKTSTPEFGLTGYTESAAAPPARDPWNLAHGAGGSSGGAATAVAAGLLPFAPGSDGGGSIRIPAATVGVVGLKPSRGRVAVGSGMEGPAGLVVAGPIARNVADAAFLLDVLVAGAPYRFATGAPECGALLPRVRQGSQGTLQIGVTTASPWDHEEDIVLESSAAHAVHLAADYLDTDGHAVHDLSWKPTGYADMFRTLWKATAARIPLTADELTRVEPITSWLVRAGRALRATDVLGALAAATQWEKQTIIDFSAYDVVLTPALAQSPRPVGWYDSSDAEANFRQQVQYAPYSSFVNVAGLPAIVVPVDVEHTGHPVCVQLIGRPGGEAAIVAAAADLERARGPLLHPPMW